MVKPIFAFSFKFLSLMPILNYLMSFQDKIPSDLKTILTTVDPELKPNIKVAKATGNNAHKLAAKQSLAKVIKHKGEDSPG